MSEQTSGLVLQSVFMVILTHSGLDICLDLSTFVVICQRISTDIETCGSILLHVKLDGTTNRKMTPGRKKKREKKKKKKEQPEKAIRSDRASLDIF